MFEPVWADIEDFQSLQISGLMWADHMPDFVLKALKKCIPSRLQGETVLNAPEGPNAATSGPPAANWVAMNHVPNHDANEREWISCFLLFFLVFVVVVVVFRGRGLFRLSRSLFHPRSPRGTSWGWRETGASGKRWRRGRGPGERESLPAPQSAPGSPRMPLLLFVSFFFF